MRARTASRPRTAILAAAAVAALAGAAVFGSALVASAAPNSVDIGTIGGVTTATGGTISGNVQWNGFGGTVRVDVENDLGVTTSYCEGTPYDYFETTWACTVNLDYGVNSITAFAEESNDLGNPITSNTITITRGGVAGPTIDQDNQAYQSTLTAPLTGTGPAMGTIDIAGVHTTSGDPITTGCTAVPVDSSGAWACTVTVPELDLYNFSATGTDINGVGTGVSADSHLDFVPGAATLTVASDPTDLSVTATTAPDGETVGITWQRWDATGAAVGGTAYCPAGWDYAGPFPTNAVQPCDLGAPLPGSYLVTSTSFANSAFAGNGGDLIRVPNVPVLTNVVPESDGTVTVTGTVDPTWTSPFTTADGGSEATVEVVGGATVCSAVPDLSNTFTCNGPAPAGLQDFRASATSVNFQGSPPSVTNYHDGTSGYSNILSAVVTNPLIKPTITCSFTAGGQLSLSGSLHVESRLYTVNPGTEGGVADLAPCGSFAGNPVTEAGAWDPSLVECLPNCSITLPAGLYNVHFSHGDGAGVGYEFVPYDYFFTIPTAPTVTSVSASGQATGTGTPGARIRLVNGSGTQICTVVVPASGSWSCAVTLPKTAGSARAYQVDVASGGAGAYSPLVALPAAAVVATPTPTPTLRPWSMTWGSATDFHPGDSLSISGADVPPGSTVDIEMHSTPVLLGSTTAKADGTFSTSVTIPADAEPGAHTIVVMVTPTDGSAPTTLDQPITVLVDDVDESAESAVGSGAVPASGSRHKPGAPSALSTPLVDPVSMLTDPLALATAGSLGLALVLLVIVPAEFFGEALANHYGAFAGFFSRRKRLTKLVSDLGTWIEENRFWAGAALIAITSLVFCFVDPGFGFDLTSLRLLLACAGSILLVNFLSSGITERVAEKAWKVPTRLEVMPWGLAIAIVGVIVSRLLNFSPGFLIGSIIGVSVVAEVSKKLEARVILLWSGVLWAIAMVSWVLAPLVPTLPEEHPAAFVTALLGDILTATAAGGLTALIVALLPIALFDGGELFRYSKLRWGIAFGVAVASFSIVVLPSASNWLGLGDGLLTWLLLTLGFITLAIVTYLIAVRKNVLSRSRLLKGAGKA